MYLEPNELIDLNRSILEHTRFVGDRPHGIQEMGDVRRCCTWTRRHFADDPFRQAAFFCCAIIAHHPFRDGNHRTSLHAAIVHLLLRGFVFQGTTEELRAMYSWRFDYEEAHHLEAQWMNALGGWENAMAAEEYLHEFTLGPYGRHIEEFLRRHCRPYPLHALIGASPPNFFREFIKRYPPAFRKEARRYRRTHAAHLRKGWARLEELQKEGEKGPRAPRQQPWRS